MIKDAGYRVQDTGFTMRGEPVKNGMRKNLIGGEIA